MTLAPKWTFSRTAAYGASISQLADAGSGFTGIIAYRPASRK